jgi:hypothetical protein
MKLPLASIAAGLAVPLALAAAPRGDSVQFRVARDAQVRKLFESRVELALDDMSMSQNGREMDTSMMGEVEVTLTTTETVELLDTYGEPGDGAPRRLEREFVGIGSETTVHSSNSVTGETDNDVGAKSPLEGKSVVFTPDDSGEMLAAYAEGEDGEPNWLEGLTEDTDLRCLLPDDGEAAADESWELPLDRLQHLLVIGGDLHWEVEAVGDQGGMGMDGMSPNLPGMFDGLEGEASATYRGRRDVDGTSCGVIAFTLEVNAANDVTDNVREAMEGQDLPVPIEIDLQSADSEIELEVQGELLWDLAGGHAHSLELSGEMRMAMSVAMAISAQGMDMEIEQTTEFSGSVNKRATFTVE